MKIRTREEAWKVVVQSLEELMEDLGQEPGELTPKTMLMGDLGITSMDGIHLMISIEDRIGNPLNYKSLAEGAEGPNADVSLGRVLDLVCRSLRIQA